MGITPSDLLGDDDVYRTQLTFACRRIDNPVSKAATRLLLHNVPHAIFCDLPNSTTSCFVDDDCIGVLAALVEEYLPAARIPFSEAEQWIQTSHLQRVLRAKSNER